MFFQDPRDFIYGPLNKSKRYSGKSILGINPILRTSFCIKESSKALALAITILIKYLKEVGLFIFNVIFIRNSQYPSG